MVNCDFYETDAGMIARLTFSVPGGVWIERVALVGDFNGWQRNSHLLHDQSDGVFTISIDVPAGPVYRFYYLSDGEPMTDPQADGFANAPDGTHAFEVNTEPDPRRRAPRPSGPVSSPPGKSGGKRQTPSS